MKGRPSLALQGMASGDLVEKHCVRSGSDPLIRRLCLTTGHSSGRVLFSPTSNGLTQVWGLGRGGGEGSSGNSCYTREEQPMDKQGPGMGRWRRDPGGRLSPCNIPGISIRTINRKEFIVCHLDENAG